MGAGLFCDMDQYILGGMSPGVIAIWGEGMQDNCNDVSLPFEREGEGEVGSRLALSNGED